MAAGTVFRTVLIWQLYPGEQHGDKSPVLLKLEGHAGVIFDVRFLSNGCVASVSDDRSLRLWKITHVEGAYSYMPIAEYYGHRSRIWKLRELGYQGLIVTASEDATCKIWEAISLESATS